MTLLVPLETSASSAPGPSFLRHSEYPDAHLAAVVKAIIKAKRIVVVCGAGISVQAGVPAFRSPEGLFKSIKGHNLVSGKDLFDASVFTSEHSISLFCQMIAQLSELSKAAEPTTFHRLLRTLDEQGKLLRVYTQNIDGIERKSGLSYGIPTCKDKPKGKLNSSSGISAQLPRCIPLHGTLQLVHCQLCNHSFPLEDHISSLLQGLPPQCPECTVFDQCRTLAGKRPRGIGKLRPSIVLYNEVHREGEDIGEIIGKDLAGSSGRSADLVLVVGTSLRVLGTKRIVREFAKVAHGRGSSLCPTAPSSAEPSAIKTVYLNLEFPVPAREWDGVFDVWLRGDAQQFAVLLDHEIRKVRRRRTKRRTVEVAANSSCGEQSRDREERHLPKLKRLKLTLSPFCERQQRSLLGGFPHKPTPSSPATKLYLRIPARLGLQRGAFTLSGSMSLTNHSEDNLVTDSWAVATECIA